MARSGVFVRVDTVRRVVESVRALTSQQVLVGIPSDRAGRRDGPITSAALGYIHENGAPEVNIPARPFLLPGVRSALPAVEQDLRRAAEAAYSGSMAGVETHLHRAGLRASTAVKAKLVSGPFAPLARGTIASRRRRGRTSIKPLIDTAQMLASVTYVIRRRT